LAWLGRGGRTLASGGGALDVVEQEPVRAERLLGHDGKASFVVERDVSERLGDRGCARGRSSLRPLP
jgi:hypothetical protein